MACACELQGGCVPGARFIRSGGFSEPRGGARVARCVVRLLLLFVCAVWSAVAAQAQDAGPGVRVIRYGGDHDFRPHEWIGEDGQPAGFQVELIRAIGEAVGARVDIQLGSWQEIKAQLLVGDIDVVGMFDQPARRSYVDFSEPHFFQASEFFIRKGSSAIRRFEDLAGKSVVVQRGALAEEEIAAAGVAVTVVAVDTEAEALQLLASGAHDCAIVTQFGGRAAIARCKLTNLTTSGAPIFASDVAFAVRRGNAEMLATINRGLAILKSTGRYNDIYDKWLGDSSRAAVSRRHALIFLAVVVLPLALIAMAAVAWSRMLARRVVQKTAELNEQLEQRRRAELALRQGEDRFQSALRASGITVCTQDTDLRITWVYDPLRVYGSGSVIGKHLWEVLPAEVAEPVTEAKRRVLETGQGTRHEVKVRTDGGVARWPVYMAGLPDDESGESRTPDERTFEIAIDPVKDEDGRITGLTSAVVDITAVKAHEERRLELERRILRAQKLESLGMLAAGVTHDFNNLLTGILSYADLARESGAVGVDEPLRNIELLARRAGELTQQLLAMTGGGQRRLAPVDLSRIADEMCRLIGPSLPLTTRIEFDAGVSVPEFEGDPTQVRQVILNLIKNAADAIGGGPGRMVVRTFAAELTADDLRAARIGADAEPGSYAGLEVSDDSAGIDPLILGRIFDSFFTTKPEGRGLGLAVVANVVQRHRGVVMVESGAGRGTAFKVYFPVAARSGASGDPRETGRSSRAAGGRTILIVDDMRAVRDFMADALRDAGYEPVTVSEGAKAFRFMREGEPRLDLIVVDVGLADMSGLAVLDRVRAERPELPMLLVAGVHHVDEASRRAGSRVGVLRKPFTNEELVRAVKRLLEDGGR